MTKKNSKNYTCVKVYMNRALSLFGRAAPGEVSGTELTVKGLVEGRPYEFRVAAVNEAGPGEFAETDSAITPAPPPS